MLLSIIIPVYNAEHVIDKCVQSIIFQTNEESELILVEDCSKDNSWEKCINLAHQYCNVKIYQNNKNSGVSFTRNIGLSHATGKYIIFIDSDDWVEQHYLKKMISVAEEHDEQLVICGLHFINMVDNYQKDYIWRDNSSEICIVERSDFFELFKSFLLPQLWNKVFRRDIIEQNHISFDISQSMGEDFDFVLDYLKASKIRQCCVINEPLYFYIRANSTSLMSRFGFYSIEHSLIRLNKLADIAGRDNPLVQKQLLVEEKTVKTNAIYSIARANKCSVKEKLVAIEMVMHDGKAILHLIRELIHIVKEVLSERLN